MNYFLAKYRPVFQLPDSGGGGTSTPAGATGDTSTSTAPAPSTTPSTPSDASPSSSPANVDGSASDSVDFSFIFGDGEPEPAKVPGTPPAEAPKPAVVAPKVAGAPEAPKPADGKAPVVEAPKAAPAPAPTGTTSPPPAQAGGRNLDPFDPGALASALRENEAQAIQHVSDTMFKLSPEEIEELETNTVGAVPKLLAKSYVRAQYNMLQQMARLIPQMMAKQTELMTRHSANEDKFYGKWSDIKKDTHGALVRQYAAVYRQMNPDATLEDMIEAVGPMVMMAAKITPSAVVAGGGNGVVPASPMAPAGGRPQSTPFTPAGPLSAGATPTTQVELSPIEAMFAPHDE